MHSLLLFNTHHHHNLPPMRGHFLSIIRTSFFHLVVAFIDPLTPSITHTLAHINPNIILIICCWRRRRPYLIKITLTSEHRVTTKVLRSWFNSAISDRWVEPAAAAITLLYYLSFVTTRWFAYYICFVMCKRTGATTTNVATPIIYFQNNLCFCRANCWLFLVYFINRHRARVRASKSTCSAAAFAQHKGWKWNSLLLDSVDQSCLGH